MIDISVSGTSVSASPPKSHTFVTATIEQSAGLPRPSWLEFDPAKATGKLTSKPDRHDLPFELNEAAIIEFYSQKL